MLTLFLKDTYTSTSSIAATTQMTSSMKAVTLTCLCLLACVCTCVQAQRRLCGRALADTLDLVCAGRGFHLGKREASHKDLNYYRKVTGPHNSFTKLASSGSSSSTNSDNIKDKHIGAESNQPVASADSPSDFSSSRPSLLTAIHDIISSSDSSSNNNNNNNNNHNNNNNNYSHLRMRRNAYGNSIVDECCIRACTFSTLESYCAAADSPEVEISMNELRHRLGFGVNHQEEIRPSAASATTTQQPRPQYVAPAAQFNKGARGRDNQSFFYVSLGSHATRSPLLRQ